MDGLEWLKQPNNRLRPRCILSMGSSIGNFARKDAADFLRDYTQILGPQDLMLVGLDACQDEERIYHAYNDRKGTTHDFIRNGLVHANALIGKELFKSDEWDVIGRYNAAKKCHQAFYRAKHDLLIEDIAIESGEEIRVEESHKYSAAQSDALWRSADLTLKACFGNQTDDFRT